jgi:hypothetical protein
VVAAFALGAFEDRGPESLPLLLTTIADALTQRWAAFRPEARRERTADSALALLLRTIRALIDFHEATRGPAWQAWAARITPSLPAACEAAGQGFRTAVVARLDSARCLNELAPVMSRAAQYFRRLPPLPEPSIESPSPSEPTPEPAPVAAVPASAPDVESRAVEVSPALATFLRKLDAFDRLVQRGDMAKAAIVAQDVRGAIDRFDPRVYFPKLLSSHFRLLSVHAAALAPYWESAGGPIGEALAQLYQVDLDAFLES